MGSPPLVLVSPLKAKRLSERQIILTRKFVDGVLEYQQYWSGPVVVLAEENASLSPNLDNVAVEVAELPFKVALVNYDAIGDREEVRQAGVVLASSDDFRQAGVGRACAALGVPCVYVTEYSLKTRMQVVRATTPNPLVRLRRYFWQISREGRIKKIVAAAAGVQCNGTPTFEAYRAINGRALLFFDTRVTQEMLATEVQMKARRDRLLAGAPLRLLFSGRLTAIKGADHLVPVVERLRSLGVKFELCICGDGDLAESIRAQVARRGLGDAVRLMGVLDFKKDLVPFVNNQVDLFVCCHRQGDPSCTYLETMSGGVPIVGYDNEAFAGLAACSGAGWSVKMNRPEMIAGKVAELDKTRDAIVTAAVKSLEFARQHTFEATFARRIAHLREAAASKR